MAEEKNQIGPAEALRIAGERFRQYEVLHAEKLHGGLEIPEMEAIAEKVTRNREAAEMCEAALASIEEMANAALEHRGRSKAEGPDVIDAFRAGFFAGERSMEYGWQDSTDSWPDDKPVPPGLEGAVAVFRAQIAKGLANG